MTGPRREIVLLTLFACAAASTPTQAQLRTVVLDENRTAAARIAAAVEQFEVGESAESIAFIEQIRGTLGGELARVSPDRYLPIEQLCHAAIRSLNPTGIRLHRETVDSSANQWLARARLGEVAQFHRILREAPLSSAGDEALFELGQSAWFTDQPGLAYEYWRRLFPANPGAELQYPQPDYEPARIAARLVLCRIAMADHTSAALELDAFQSRFPTARGTLLGQEGVFVNLLREQLHSISWAPVRRMEPHAWRPVWARRTSSKPEPAHHLVSNPSIGKRGVFLFDGSALRGYSTQDGLNLWTGEPDATIFSSALPSPPDRIEGLPRFEPTLADGRMLIRTGSAVTILRVRDPDARAFNAVVCIDIDRRQGKRLWQVIASDIVEGGAFESAPAVWGTRCFVVLRESPPASSLHVACLSLEDGEILWQRRLCAGLDEPGESTSRYTSLRPVVSSTHVIVPTNNGAVFALHHAGGFAWVRTYERSQPGSATFTGVRAIVKHGSVYFAPADASSVFAARLHTGELKWQRPLPDRIQTMVDVVEGTLVVCGRGPWGLEATTGAVNWGGPRYAPEHFGYGQGVTSGSTFFFPTREQIEVRDVLTGRALRAPLRLRGGNMAVAGRRVAIAASNVLTVLEEQ